MEMIAMRAVVCQETSRIFSGNWILTSALYQQLKFWREASVAMATPKLNQMLHMKMLSPPGSSSDTLGLAMFRPISRRLHFFGSNDEYVVAGSDDGRVFLWEAGSGRLVGSWTADEDIVNCVQPHPFDPVLATSGIENCVRLWAPGPTRNGGVLRGEGQADIVRENQENMQAGPFSMLGGPFLRQLIMMQMMRRSDGEQGAAGGGEGREEEEVIIPSEQCVQS
mmetsp:Transcript_43737/g.72451  ORF Transcript_43737/g.72451 Transcript_43737/m.72451 type:complete len:223 (+) Transcript_43737:324-992(+)